MKTVFFITSLGGGGAERVVCNLSNYLHSKAEDVSISAIRGGAATYNLDANIKVTYLQEDYYNTPTTLKRRLEEIRKVYNFLRSKGRDHTIVCFLELPVAYALIFKPFVKAKVIICERNNPEFYSKSYQKLYKLLADRADMCVCQTNVIANWYRKIISNDSRIKVIPNSINQSILDSPIGNRSKKEIVTMARLAPQKNQRMLIEAFAEIVNSHPDYSLTIYGEGPLREELTSLAESLKVSDKVKFPGFTKDVIGVLSTASMFVMTSDHEGMPNALAEAMAMGVPCVSTDCGGGGARELIDNGKNGLLIPCRDKEALVNAMKSILEDQAKANAISKEAVNIRQRLDPDFIHSQWRDLFQHT